MAAAEVERFMEERRDITAKPLPGPREVQFSRWLMVACGVAALIFYVTATFYAVSVIDYRKGWFDQAMYLLSARAFAAGDLSPELHWYPLLYSLAAAPFVPLLPSAPFFPLNTICSAASAFLFVRICSIFGISKKISIPALIISLALPATFFYQFIVPWNTIPVVALTLACFYILIRPDPLSDRSVLTLAGAGVLVPLLRPVDALSLMPFCLAAFVRLRDRPLVAFQSIVLATAIVALYAVLHFAIYGTSAPPYMSISKNVGFDFGHFTEKAYALLIDPKPLYGVGTGIVTKAPWLLLTPYGAVVLTLKFGWRGAIGPLSGLITFVTYSAYADLTPYAFWMQFNAHYLSGALLIAAICSTVAAVRIYGRPVELVGASIIPVILALITYKVSETAPSQVVLRGAHTIIVRCDRCASYDAIDIANVRISDLYQGSVTPEDQLHIIVAGTEWMRNIHDFRAIPQRDGVRLLFDEPIAKKALLIRFSEPHRLRVPPRVSVIDGRFAPRFLPKQALK